MFDHELTVQLILDGLDPIKAIAAGAAGKSSLRGALLKSAGAIAAKAARMGGLNPGFVKYAVETTGPLRNIPDPVCVAQQLNKIPNPTREDVLRALQHCAR